MKNLNNYTCRTKHVLAKQLQMLWRTAMVIAAVFLLNPGAFAQDANENLRPCWTGCTANDFTITSVYLAADPNGNDLLEASDCTEPGQELQAYLSFTFRNNTSSDRNGIYLSATIDGQPYYVCFSGVLPKQTSTTFTYTTPITWECGTSLILEDAFIGWGNASEQVCNLTCEKPGDNPTTSKCRTLGDYIVNTPFIPDFSFNIDCEEGNSFSTVSFTDETTGGFGNYTYAWDFGDGNTSTEGNPEYTCSGAGTFDVTLTVTDTRYELDNDGNSTGVVISTETEKITKQVVVVACCVPPTVTTQPANESVCAGEAASFTVVYTGGEPAPSIQWEVSTDGGTIWTEVENGEVYSGATTATLSIIATSIGMNGNLYRAALTSGTCDAVYTEPAALEVNEIPAAPTVKSDEFCVSGGTVTLADFIDAAGTVIFTNDAGGALAEQPTTLSLATAGVFIYYVVQQEGDCVSEVASFTITINENPEAPVLEVTQPNCTVATGTFLITSSTTDLMFRVDKEGDDDDNDYVAYPTGGWSGLAAGTYNVTAKNEAGCISAVATVVINSQPATPNANAGADKVLTCTTLSVMLNGSSTTAGVTYSWVASDGGNIVSGANTATPTVNAAGTYTLTVTNPATGCAASDVVIITRDATLPEVTITTPTGAPILKCNSTSVLLGSLSNIENGVYSWTGPGGFTSDERSITVTVAGTYVLTVVNPVNGCSASTSITITAPFYPEISAGPDKVLTCVNTTATLEGSMELYGTNSLRWVASDGGNIVSGETTLNPVVNAPGTYTMIVTHVTSACESKDVVVVTRDASTPNVSAKGGTLSCANGSLQLMGHSTTAGVNYHWTGPNGYTSSMQHPTVTVAGQYTLTVTNRSNGCTASTTVTVNPQPRGSDPIVTCHTMSFGYNHYRKGLITKINTPKGPVAVTGRKRNPDGTYAAQNHAALFDTQAPTGDDTDLYTTDWGLALIINQDQTSVPNDNQWGGELILDFSAIGPVTMESLRALDIDNYEDMSWIYLYDGAGRELHKVRLQNLGDNSKQMVNLGNTKGVMMMKIVLDGRNESDHLAGSGAIDDIRFCVEEPGTPCVDEQEVMESVSITNVSAYPSPFFERATIEFRMRETENYVVNLYDTKGMLIKQLKTGTAIAGELNAVEVDGRDLSEGLYLARIASGSGAKTVKLILKR